MTLLNSFIANALEKKGSVTFWGLNGAERTYSYQELLDGSLLVAQYLRSQQLPLGARVAIVLPTSVHFYFAFWGTMLAGGIPTALYPPLRLGRLEEWEERTLSMMKVAEAYCVLSDELIAPFMAKLVVQANCPIKAPIIEKILESQSSGLPLEKASRPTEDDLAFIQFSSGSTGVPRAVSITHGNLLNNVKTIIEQIDGLGISKRGVSWLPLYHDMGLVGAFMGAVYSAGDLCLIRPEQFIARPILWFQAMSGFKATIGVAPNFAYSLSLEKIQDDDLRNLDLSSMKVLMSGAEPVHPVTMEKFYQKFSKIGLAREALLPVYGLAEGTLAVSFRPIGKGTLWKNFDRNSIELADTSSEKRLGAKVQESENGMALAAVGFPLPGMEIRIGDEMANDLGSERVGKIWIAGPSVARAEFNKDSCLYQGKWLDTGDRGFFYQGELYICGREKDILIIRGRNIDPAPIEQVISEIPEIRSGCVALFPVPDEAKGGEMPIIVAELRRMNDLDATKKLKDKISQIIRDKFQINLAEIVLVDSGSLPRTSSGKIQRRRCRDLYAHHALNRGSGHAKLKALKAWIVGKYYQWYR